MPMLSFWCIFEIQVPSFCGFWFLEGVGGGAYIDVECFMHVLNPSVIVFGIWFLGGVGGEVYIDIECS